MTTGSKLIGTLGALGYSFQKSWNGADDTPKKTNTQVQGPSFAYTGWKKLKNGQVVPVIRWHKPRIVRPPKRARSRGEHPYTMSLTEISKPRCALYSPSGIYQMDWIPGDYNLPNIWTANDDIKLVGKLKDKLQGSDFDLSLFLGTGHQTLGMLADTAGRIYGAYKDVRRGQIGMAAKKLTGKMPPSGRSANKTNPKALAAAWLELQYGWRPLVQDCFNLAEFLAEQLNFPMRTTYRVARMVETKMTPASGYEKATLNHAFNSSRLIARIQEKPSAVVTLGLQNPENLAWELLPWSFVADWFIPIGDYLAARAFASHLEGTFITTRYDSGLVIGTTYNDGSKSSRGGEQYVCKRIRMTRTVSTTLVVPMPNVKPLGKVASWQHCANAVGLLTQLSRDPRFFH